MLANTEEEDDPFKEEDSDFETDAAGKNAESSSSPPSGLIKPGPLSLSHDMIMNLHFNRPIPVRLPEPK